LTTLFGTNALPILATVEVPAAPKKRGWLPVLVVLFLVSYSLMTMLIVEQGRTIESQRALIRELFRDSTELSAVKQKVAQENAQTSSAKTQSPVTQNPSSQTQSTQTPSTQAPSNHYPSTQAPASQTPSSQTGPQQQRTQSQSGKQKPDFKMPSKPIPDLIDDVRTLTTI
jgi:cytoskeletal protein RodZ